MRLLINIPAFNEEKVIKKTIQSLPRQISGFSEVKIQVIDDGSKDQTKEKAKQAGADFIYSHKINRGLGQTFKQAVHHALINQFDLMVNIDADGQFNPKDIEKLVKPILENKADIVIGSRFSGIKPQNMPFFKRFMNQLGARLVGWFLSIKTPDLTCGFRAYNREALLKLNLNHQFTYTQETIIDALSKNLVLLWIPIEVQYFKNRKSKMTKSIFNFIYQSMMIIFRTIRDTKPLKFFGLPATLITVSGLIIYLIIGIEYLRVFFLSGVFKISPYKNWLFFASILLLMGIQFLVFAFLADMIKSSRKIIEEEAYERKKNHY